jgi:hypothetical protein
MLVVLGLSAVVFAAIPRNGRAASVPAPETSEVLAELESQGGADQPQAPRAAARSPSPEPQSPAPQGSRSQPASTPVASTRSYREVAPNDAQSVSSFKPIAGSGSISQQSPQSSLPAPATGPWSVAIVGSPPADLMLSLIGAFRSKGMEVFPADSAVKADAVLALSSAAGGAAWYCESPRSGSSAWASSLLNALPSSSDQEAPPGFDCGALQGGWPRTPAALLQVPPSVTPASLAKSLAESVSTYFGRNGASLRRGRAAARLLWPATGAITSPYGPAHPLGIDIGQWEGPIRAATDGTVYFAGGDPCCSYGRFVVIDSPDGIRTLYGHLDSLAVKTGQKVKAGQTLGQVGCTGTCFGTHLHFEVIDRGLREDPMAYLP